MNKIEKEFARWRDVRVPEDKKRAVYHSWFGGFPLLRWIAGAGIGLFAGGAGLVTAAPGSPFYPVKQAVQAHLVVQQSTPAPTVVPIVTPTIIPTVPLEPTGTVYPSVKPQVSPTVTPVPTGMVAEITPNPTLGPSIDTSVRIPAIILPTPITVELHVPVPLPIDRTLPDISL